MGDIVAALKGEKCIQDAKLQKTTKLGLFKRGSPTRQTQTSRKKKKKEGSRAGGPERLGGCTNMHDFNN